MIVLLDTNILIDVALDRKPFSKDSSRFMDMAERRLFSSFIAWHSISSFYYIVSSTNNNNETRKFIKELLQFVTIAPTTTKDIFYALTLTLPDFEDALQVAAAKACIAEKIVTWNTKHYKNTPIPAQTPTTFIRDINYRI